MMLSDFYSEDCPEAIFVAQNVCTYSPPPFGQDAYVNRERYIIDDGFHGRASSTQLEDQYEWLLLYRVLSVFGDKLRVVRPAVEYPSPALSQHWAEVLQNGGQSQLKWAALGEENTSHIVRFPMESLSKQQHAVDPDVLYEVTSKSFIGKIPCGQAKILDKVKLPSVLKLDRASGGEGVFIVRDLKQYHSLMAKIEARPHLTGTVLTEYVNNQTKNYDAVIYIDKGGSMRWLGTVEQLIVDSCQFAGCLCELEPQAELEKLLRPTVEPVRRALHDRGYFGMVTVDILMDAAGRLYVVDINPRWGGCTPALLGLLRLREKGHRACLMKLQVTLPGPLPTLLKELKAVSGGEILLPMACGDNTIMCDLVVFASSLEACHQIYCKVQELQF